MKSEHHPHFFECTIEIPELANYQLRVKEGEHDRFIYDPYAFRSPKLTEFDLHLFSEGNHHRIYEKLGAHLTSVDGITGVYFAVWAPNARNVSVLGDFNYWDGRKHQMRKSQNGIWELFIPGLLVGTHYKYEVKNQDGHPYEKSDPYGFQQEVLTENRINCHRLKYLHLERQRLDRTAATHRPTDAAGFGLRMPHRFLAARRY